MRALVTGGAGFIGSNLVGRLVREGWDVTVLDNFLSGHRENLMPYPHVRLIDGDIRDSELVWRTASGVDTIFHLAASVGNQRSLDHPTDDASINVVGTVSVLEAARRHRIRKVVFSSSALVYGEALSRPIKESDQALPNTPYGASKLHCESLCRTYSSLYGIATISFRYFNVYGPNQRPGGYGAVVPSFAYKLMNREPVTLFGDGEQVRDFIHVSDVVEANYLAATSPSVTGVYNLGAGQGITINALLRCIAAETECKPLLVRANGRPGDARHSVADINALQEVFRFAPEVGLLDGMRDYLSWARSTVKVLSAA